MKLRYWIIILILGVSLAILLPISLSSYSRRDTIRRATDTDFLQTISMTLSPTNSHFAVTALTIKDVRYVSDTVAVVKIFNTVDNVGAFLVFELKDNTMYITNYSSMFFLSGDFAMESAIVTQIINTSGGM